MENDSLCLRCNNHITSTRNCSSICERCLFQTIIKDHLRKLEHGTCINIICPKKSVCLSLNQIREILKDKDSIVYAEPSQNMCSVHKVINDIYCIDCQIDSCSACAIKGMTHFGHNYQTTKELKDHLTRLPSIDCLNLDEVEQQFNNEFNQIFISTLRQYENLIQTLERRRSEFIKEMRELYTTMDISLQIIRLLYTQFYTDIKKQLNIKELIFLHQVKLLAPAIQIKAQKMKDSQLTKLNAKVEAQLTFTEIKFGNFFCTHTLSEHSDSIYSLLQMKNGQIVTCSRDKTIKIWDIHIHQNIFTCVQTLTGHSDAVYSILELQDRRLVSGSNDKTIRIWENRGNVLSCSHVLSDHTSSVYLLLQLKDGRLLSGSNDKSIKVWESIQTSFICTHTIREHVNWLRVMIQLRDGRLACGSDEKKIGIWEIHQDIFAYTNTLTGHTNSILCLIQLKDGRLVSGSADSTMRIWELGDNHSHSHTSCCGILTGHASSVKGIFQLKDGRMASGSVDNTIRIWEIREDTFTCTQILKGHSNSIHSLLQLHDGRIASGSEDNSVRIWEQVFDRNALDETKKNCVIY